jgi:hypothetical protein
MAIAVLVIDANGCPFSGQGNVLVNGATYAL